jgi:hypothetical protein
LARPQGVGAPASRGLQAWITDPLPLKG